MTYQSENKILGLETENVKVFGKDDCIVKTINWTRVITKDGLSVQKFIKTHIKPNFKDSGFIEYESLTEQQIQEWITLAINQEELNKIDQELLDNIDRSLKPSRKLPWE